MLNRKYESELNKFTLFFILKIDSVLLIMYNYPENVIKVNKRGRFYDENKNENSVS